MCMKRAVASFDVDKLNSLTYQYTHWTDNGMFVALVRALVAHVHTVLI